MSLVLVLHEIGNEVEIVTGYTEQITKLCFSDMGISITDLFTKDECTVLNVFSKLLHWRRFSKRAWKYIEEQKNDGLLWVSTADTALALGKKLFQRHYVLQILELYDTFPFYRHMLAKYARNANCVVVPEMCRAAIFRSWYGLNATPIVLPNKPDQHPGHRNLKIADEQARNMLTALKPNEKILLYQGHITIERDVRAIASAIQKIGDGWRFVVMGPVHGDYLDKLRKSCPNVIYIPRIIAPDHLQITSHAHIGVITYSWDKLNHVFCAPNKIWEYAGFGLPMICNELPSLQYSVEANNAGICVDMADGEQIESAIKKINNNYDSFSIAALQLYDSIDVHKIVQHITDIASSR